jgi:DNA polymerase IIIc chi subunit
MKTVTITLNEVELDRLSDTLWRRKADQFVSREELQNLRNKVDRAIVELDDLTRDTHEP